MVFLLLSIREKLTAANKKYFVQEKIWSNTGCMEKIDDIRVPFISSVYYSSIWTNIKYDPTTIIISFPAIKKTFNNKHI